MVETANRHRLCDQKEKRPPVFSEVQGWHLAGDNWGLKGALLVHVATTSREGTSPAGPRRPALLGTRPAMDRAPESSVGQRQKGKVELLPQMEPA